MFVTRPMAGVVVCMSKLGIVAAGLDAAIVAADKVEKNALLTRLLFGAGVNWVISLSS